MILDVPYQSQLPLEDDPTHNRWCGIACLTMVLKYHLKEKAPSAEEILKEYGESFEFSGFQHRDLLKIAREYGLRGFRKSWWAEPGVDSLLENFRNEGESDEDIIDWLNLNEEESLFSLIHLLNQDIPVIISVNEKFSPSKEHHLVLLIGEEEGEFIIHDPYKKGESFRVSISEFKNYWIRQAIIIKRSN